MKNKKGLIVGIIILVLLLGAYFLLRYLNLDEEDTEEGNASETVLKLMQMISAIFRLFPERIPLIFLMGMIPGAMWKMISSPSVNRQFWIKYLR